MNEENDEDSIFLDDADYFRDLLERCGEAIGPRAYQADDGTISECALHAKIPEIIEKDYKAIAAWNDFLDRVKHTRKEC